MARTEASSYALNSLQSSFCHTPLEQAALAFLPGARSAAEVVTQAPFPGTRCSHLPGPSTFQSMPVLASSLQHETLPAVQVRETVRVLLGLAACLGVATAAAAVALPCACPGLFTRDAALWPLMRSVAPQVRGRSLTSLSLRGPDLPVLLPSMYL